MAGKAREKGGKGGASGREKISLFLTFPLSRALPPPPPCAIPLFSLSYWVRAMLFLSPRCEKKPSTLIQPPPFIAAKSSSLADKGKRQEKSGSERKKKRGGEGKVSAKKRLKAERGKGEEATL